MKRSKAFITLAVIAVMLLSCMQFTANQMKPQILSVTNQQHVFTAPKASTLTLHAPITITSDSDWATYATSGNGSTGNPWVIENFYIDATGTPIGISIQNTNDYAMIRNCFVNSSIVIGIFVKLARNIVFLNDVMNASENMGMLVDQSNDIMINTTKMIHSSGIQLVIDNCSNIRMLNSEFINCTMSGSPGVWTTPDYDAGRNYNLTFDNCTFQSQIANSSDYLLDVMITTGLIVNNCTFENASSLRLDGSPDNIYNVLINDSIFRDFAVYGIRAYNAENVTIKCCSLDASKYRTHNFPITLHVDTNITVDHCNITGYSLTAIEGSANAYINYIDNTIARDNYSQGPGGGNYNYASGFETGYTDYITIRGNWFYNCSPCIAVINGIDPCIIGNYFHDHLDDIGGHGLYNGISNYTWAGNFYSDYFQFYPNANVMNVSTDILNHVYSKHDVIDLIPRYYAPWFPRSTVVNLNFFSNVNHQGITQDKLIIMIDAVQSATLSPVILHVLFHLVVHDYNMRLYYDKVLNLNAIGDNLNVGLDAVAQVFVSYYSTIDQFGFDFSLAKLFINSTRIPISDPLMISKMANFTIKDFANRTLYSHVLNIAVTSIYVDIGLPITTLTVHNNFTFGVVFHYSIANVNNSFPLAGGEYFNLRVALGMYKWWVTDENNNYLQYGNGSVIRGSKDVKGPASITFGSYTLPFPNDPRVEAQTQINIIISILTIAGLTAAGIVLAFLFRGKRYPNKKPWGA